MWRDVAARRLVGAVAAALLALAVPLAAAPASANAVPYCGDNLAADLSAGILYGADSVTLIYEKTVTFRMINWGPGCTGPATLTITGLPSKPTISSGTLCRWSSGKVVCTVDNLNADGELSVQLTLGTWTPRWVTAKASSEKPDPHTGNNTSRKYICTPGTKMTTTGPYHCATPAAKTTVPKASSSPSPSPTPSASPTASASPSPLETPSVSATATLEAIADSSGAPSSTPPVTVISVVCGVSAGLVVAALVAVALIRRRKRRSSTEVPQEPLP